MAGIKLSDISTSEDSTEVEAPNPLRIGGEGGEVDLDWLRQQSIFFATPCYGGMITDQYFLSMFKALS